MSYSNSPGGVIILQSGPASGKSLLPRLLLAPFNLHTGKRTIVLEKDTDSDRLYRQVFQAAEGIVIIDEVRPDNHRGLQALLNVMARPEMKHILFVLLTQSKLPDVFYSVGLSWQLTPILKP